MSASQTGGLPARLPGIVAAASAFLDAVAKLDPEPSSVSVLFDRYRAIHEAALRLDGALGGRYGDPDVRSPVGIPFESSCALRELAVDFERLIGNDSSGWGLRCWEERPGRPPGISDRLLGFDDEALWGRIGRNTFEINETNRHFLNAMRRNLDLLRGSLPGTEAPVSPTAGTPNDGRDEGGAEARKADRFITYAQACEAHAVKKVELTRWANAGKIADNGVKGRGRKIEAASLTRFLTSRDRPNDDVS